MSGNSTTDSTAPPHPNGTACSPVAPLDIHLQHIGLAVLLSVVIVIVIVGNTLVILAVLTTRRLRTVTNCFVMSLAVADWLLLYTDTDSLILKIETENFYNFMKENISYFDTSNYPADNKFNIPITKSVVGNMKDEFPNDPIVSFYGTGAKAYYVQSLSSELKKAKDLILDIAESYIYIEGKFIPNDLAKTCHLSNNALAFLFDEIRYEMGGEQVCLIRKPGITTTMKSMISYGETSTKFLDTVGWGLDENKQVILDTPSHTFSGKLPLKFLMGFAEDYNKGILNIKQELILIIARSFKNSYMGEVDANVTINKIEWKIRHVMPSDRQKLKLLNRLNKSSTAKIKLAYRMWDLYELPAIRETASDIWAIKTTSSLERPRYIIIGFQSSDNTDDRSKDATKFIHAGVNNIRLYLNSEVYPYERWNLDFDRKLDAVAYYAYENFQRSYYGKDMGEPMMSIEEFRKNPLFIIDCYHQPDAMKTSTVDIKLEFETRETKFPPNTKTASKALVHSPSESLLNMSYSLHNEYCYALRFEYYVHILLFVTLSNVDSPLDSTWELGWVFCDILLSLDVLLCTASILSLCAISVDRYLAVTQPLRYDEPGRHEGKVCRYNRNTGYVIFSALGSFFIPMVVMLYVYVRISCVVAQRHDNLGHIDTAHPRKKAKLILNAKEESDPDRISSECEEAHLKCSRYYLPVDACSHSPEPLSQNSQHDQPKKTVVTPSRSLRSTINYSFSQVHDPLTPSRAASLYRATFPLRTRPESLNLDASMLNFEPSSRVSSFRRETKTAQTLSIVMGGFIACWLPFFIFYLLTPFINTNEVNGLIMSYLTWLGWLNSAINPFIYAFYSPDFRIAFWRLTVKHFSKNRRADFASQHK
ncbi:unnamed protein product [Phaedon cochleariae]|uniref:G-protein coupled receptors family 1 profile domain-containing protein n=1 Tax=Phaedon cochleariae TaxID=80249 RepID=A0A9N9X1M6_PHACE|nr:unnamed protein product [Phaedon cochleariae]